MDVASLLRLQFKMAHEFLEGTMEGVTTEQVHWAPPGTANSIGANYGHIVLNEDLAINGLLKGGTPLSAGAWSKGVGLSEMPPLGPGADYHPWGRRVRIDVRTLREFGQAVYSATDDYLRSLKPADLDRTLDLAAAGLSGEWTVARLLSAALWNACGHCGEISCLKGVQGLQGYPG